ncbi:MAG: DUF2313 domain-containing protein [Evtepia gabavorous]
MWWWQKTSCRCWSLSLWRNCDESWTELAGSAGPAGVYRWEGSFQWGELQSEGEALDQVAEQVALLQREMNLYTAQAEGLTGLLELLGLERAGETLEELRQTVAALLRIGGDSFTLAAMNDTLRGCGIPAQVEETEDPLEVVVSFPGVEGIPAGFEQTKARIEEILPCHLLVKYQFSDSV